MFMITLEASYAHCMKMIASLTSLNVFGMEMMGKLEVILFFVEEFSFCPKFQFMQWSIDSQ